jgi:hypothetical protein
MKRFLIMTSVLAVVLAFTTFSSSPAKAEVGVHLAGPGYHIDFGRSHHHDGYYGHHRRVAYGFYGGDCYRGSRWHDTSHYDYHPGEFVRHRNHYHYVPGHWDYHETGHWDHW